MNPVESVQADARKRKQQRMDRLAARLNGAGCCTSAAPAPHSPPASPPAAAVPAEARPASADQPDAGESRDAALDLTDRQRTVINLLVMGRTVSSAAADVAVHRNTVHRWKTQSPVFAAELRRRQAEVWEAISHRIRCLMLHAVRVAERALDHPEHAGKTALKLLAQGGMRTWIIPPDCPTDERAVIDEMALARRSVGDSSPAELEAPVTPDERRAVLRDAPRDDEIEPPDRAAATARACATGRPDLAEIDLEPPRRPRGDRYRRESVEQILDELLSGDFETRGVPDHPPPPPAADAKRARSG